MEGVPQLIKDALEFDKTKQRAFVPPEEDHFYRVDASTVHLAPGKLITVERDLDTSRFSLPPGSALSRFVYQSKSMAGASVPVSACILWPHAPRVDEKGHFHVVAWSHGTSGLYADAAPSQYKNLWQHYLGPFPLVQQGYVVVATDYAGLGVATTGDGRPIHHEYLSGPAQANDVAYSILAAREAFPGQLSSKWVVAGHSQGGGSAWAVAQRQVHDPVDGFLGTVALAPFTRIPDQLEPIRSVVATANSRSVQLNRPEVDVANSLLTALGRERQAMTEAIGGNTAIILSICLNASSNVADADSAAADAGNKQTLVQESAWEKFKDFYDEIGNGGKPIAEPMLIMHGNQDPVLNVGPVREWVDKTMELSQNKAHPIDFVELDGVSHNATCTAAQWIWLDWIARRFANAISGTTTNKAHAKRVIRPPRPVEAYQKEINWWIAGATEFYHAP